MRFGRHAGRWPALVAFGALLVAATGGVASAATAPPIAPPGEPITDDEAAYWVASVPCPPAPAGYQLVEQARGTNLLPDVTVTCRYGSAADVVDVTLEWNKPGKQADLACTSSASPGRQPVGTHDAVVRLEGSGDLTVFEPLVAPLASWVASVADPCPTPVPCPAVEGYPSAGDAYVSAREGFVMLFGSSGRTSTLSVAECSYSPDSGDLPYVRLEALWAGPAAEQRDVVRACSMPAEEIGASGVVRHPDAAAYGLYLLDTGDAVDTARYQAAARSLVDEVAAGASSCEGVAVVAVEDAAVPPALSAAFAAEVVAPAAPSVPTTTVPDATAEPSAGESEVTTVSGDDERSTLWTAVGVVATAASLGLVALAVVMARRETRVRPLFDWLRVAVGVAVGVVLVVLFSQDVPLWALAVALALGLALGAWQGRHLLVRRVGRRLVSKRTGWALVAFGAGLAVAQVAGYLDRAGAIAVGVAVTFFSAALGAGLIVGRQPKLAEAARVGAATALLVLLVVASGTPGRAGGQEPDTAITPDERTPGQEAVLDLVDWTSVGIRAGLFADEGKPFVTVAVPRALDAAPAPTTVSTSWSRGDDRFREDYTVTETYTFALRPDGLCCTVEYAGTGSVTSGGFTDTYEASGRLDDLQSLAVEGDPSGYDPTGIPFTAPQALPVAGMAGPGEDMWSLYTCQRVVAASRSSADLDETGGAGQLDYRVNGEPREAPEQALAVTMGVPCDVPGFTPEAALAVAPPPPATDDPARQGCPVYQELLGALVPVSTFDGVDTRTTGTLFVDPNQPACRTSVTLGKEGPGGTRHELSLDLAAPAEAGATLVDADYWTDLPLPSDVTTAETCSLDESGMPVAPADPEAGCQHSARYRVGDVQVLVFTDWVTLDGPNVLVFVRAPWGSYAYRCHHCTPTDPSITAFLAALNGVAAPAGLQLAAAAPAGTTAVPADDTGTTGDDDASVPPTTAPDDDDASVPPTTAPDDDVGKPSGGPDAAPLASLTGLAGAAALLAIGITESRTGDGDGDDGGDEAGPGNKDLFDQVNQLASFLSTRDEYTTKGFDTPTASALAALEVAATTWAGDESRAPFSDTKIHLGSGPVAGVDEAADGAVKAADYLADLGNGLLPEGVKSALLPAEVVKNYLRTGIDVVGTLGETAGLYYHRGYLDLGAFDDFGDRLNQRTGPDPFKGWGQLFDLADEELARTDGRTLVDDWNRTSWDDWLGAGEQSATEFDAEVAAGSHGVVLQGVHETMSVLGSVALDPASILEWESDAHWIVQQGVLTDVGFWSEVSADVAEKMGSVPAVGDVFKGYRELFGGVLAQVKTTSDLANPMVPTLRFAREMADGALALAAEAGDLWLGGDAATRTYDYVRSWF